MITPSNFVAWCKHIGGRRFRFGFREHFSGSGRLSLCSYQQCLCISPPLDHRYGWDLGVAQHQNMIDNSFLDSAIVNWYSPKCTPWVISSSWKASRASIETKRKDEAPTLQWIARKLQSARTPVAHTIEQPAGSQMFTESVLASSLVSCNMSIAVLDQCQYGAVQGNMPIQKCTVLRSAGIHLFAALDKRCTGINKCPKHQTLQGRGEKGVPRTAQAAVYPQLFCVQAIREVAAHFCSIFHSRS